MENNTSKRINGLESTVKRIDNLETTTQRLEDHLESNVIRIDNQIESTTRRINEKTDVQIKRIEKNVSSNTKKIDVLELEIKRIDGLEANQKYMGDKAVDLDGVMKAHHEEERLKR